MMESVITHRGLQAAAAEIFLVSAICVILLIDVFLSDRRRWITYGLSLLTLAGSSQAAEDSTWPVNGDPHGSDAIDGAGHVVARSIVIGEPRVSPRDIAVEREPWLDANEVRPLDAISLARPAR